MFQDARFVSAVEAIYASALTPAHWPTALRLIADVFGDIGAVLAFQHESGVSSNVTSLPGVGKMARASEALDVSSAFPASSSVRRWTASQHSSRDISIISNAERPIDFADHPMRSGFRVPGEVAAASKETLRARILLERALNAPAYSGTEIEIYRELCRHADKALRLSLCLQSAEAERSALQQAVSKFGIGVLALDSLRRVILSNPAAETLLNEAPFIVNERREIAILSNPEIERVIDLILAGAPSPGPHRLEPMVVRRDNRKRPLVLYCVSVWAESTPAQAFLTHARMLMLLVDSDASPLPDPSTVRDVLRITLGEARVASLVGSGLSPRQAAERLGISEETARTVLKRVFAKIGVERQSELAVLLSRLTLRY